MPGIPWWGWLLAGLILLFFVGRWAMSQGFRALIRREFSDFLKDVDPAAEVAYSGGVAAVTSAGTTRRFELEPVYAIGREVPDSHQRMAAYWGYLNEFSGQPDRTWPVLSLERFGDRIVAGLQPAHEVPADADVPHTPFGSTGLIAACFLDGKRTSVPLDGNRLRQLGLDTAGIHALAIKNLSRSFPQDALDNVLKNGEASAIQAADGHNAARILVAQQSLPDGVSIAALIPDSQSLVLMPAPEDGNWETLQQAATIPLGQGYPLLQRPVRLTRTGAELA
jgi:hypothetical protein